MRALVALLLCGLATTALGHGGGGYRGPPGEVPPDSAEPSDPPPPPEAPLSWTDWWANEHDSVIAPRGAFGRGPARRAALEAAPRLRALLVDETRNVRVRCAAMLALARIGDETVVPFAKRMIRAQDDSVRVELRECAALALGLARRDEDATRAFLADVVRDAESSRSFVGPFAAVSLGLLGAGDTHDSARALVDAVSSGRAGMRPACFLALGLLGDASATAELESVVRDGNVLGQGAAKLPDGARAFAVEALVRVGAPDGGWFDVVAALLADRRSPDDAETRRAAYAALGRFAPLCPIERRRALRLLLLDGANAPMNEDERRLSLVSLGRLGAVETDEKALAEIRATLRRALRDADGAAPFAAFGLGLLGAARPLDAVLDLAPLRRGIVEHPAESARGAFALAAGLARDRGAVESILRPLADPMLDRGMRGECAVALGLMDAWDQVPAARRARTTLSNEDFVVEVATAQALLEDAVVVDDFVAVLRDGKASRDDVSTACVVLSRVGDQRAVEALLDVARDERLVGLAPLAVEAIGRIGARDDVRIATDADFRVRDAAIEALLCDPWLRR